MIFHQSWFFLYVFHKNSNGVLTPCRAGRCEKWCFDTQSAERIGDFYYINFGTENVNLLHILISKTYEKSLMGTNRWLVVVYWFIGAASSKLIFLGFFHQNSYGVLTPYRNGFVTPWCLHTQSDRCWHTLSDRCWHTLSAE